MLGPVVHKGAVYVLHARDCLDVEDKNQNAEYAFQNRNQGLVCENAAQKSRQKHGQQHENADGREEGKRHDDTHHHLHGLFAEDLLKEALKLRGFLLFLLSFRVNLRRPVQRAHTEYHGIRKAEHAAHKGQSKERITIRETHVALPVHRNALIFAAHRAGVILPVLHHDAFQYRLSADAGVFLFRHTSPPL